MPRPEPPRDEHRPGVITIEIASEEGDAVGTESKSPAKHTSWAVRKEADMAEAGGKEKEDGEGSGERRSSVRRGRKVNEK